MRDLILIFRISQIFQDVNKSNIAIFKSKTYVENSIYSYMKHKLDTENMHSLTIIT